MKATVSKSSNISSDKLFYVLKQSLKDDYTDNTQKGLLDKDIKEGLTFIKRFGKNEQNSVKVVLTSFIENKLYEAAFSSNRGRQIISYEIDTVTENECIVKLKQETVPSSIAQKFNDKIISILFKRSIERRLSAQLTALFNVASSNQL